MAITRLLNNWTAWLLNLNLIYETLWSLSVIRLLISVLEKLNWLRLTNLTTLVLLMWKWMGLFLRKNHLLRCWGWLSVLNWIGTFTLSLLLKLSPRKLEPWFVRWSFFLLRVLCICINLLQPCMECCRHVWDGAHSFYWELLNKLQKWICSIVGPSLAASLEPLAHIWNVPSWSLFYMYYFGRCSSELVELVPLSYSLEWSTRYSDRLHDFFCHYSKIL